LPVRSRAFPSSPEATADARRFLRETAGDNLHAQVLADALLLTNELVTNVIKHAGHEPEDPIEIVIALDEPVLKVTVRDRGPGFDRTTRRERTEDGGWGLDLVKALASRWGVDRTASGTDVWFEIDRS
jgi:anti-sigma regulatory factor (Ser/Thr protein kinase)